MPAGLHKQLAGKVLHLLSFAIYRQTKLLSFVVQHIIFFRVAADRNIVSNDNAIRILS